MNAPRRRKPVAAPLPSARTLARPLTPHAVTDAPRGYPTAAALFASGGLTGQLGATLRALLGPAALMGAVGVAACGPLDAPPKADPVTDTDPSDAKTPPDKPDDAASPPNDIAVPGTPSVVLTPLPPQPGPTHPPFPHHVDTGRPPTPSRTPPIIDGPLPPLHRPPISRGAMQHIEPEPLPPEPLPPRPEPILPRHEPVPLGGAPMPVHPPPPPPPPVRPAPHPPQAPGRIMVRPDVE
jgi:hypothetical protein